MIANLLCSFIGTICFSILFNVQRQFYLYCGFTGMAGWMCYCFFVPFLSPALSTFMATVVVVLLSRVFAVWRKCPITVFLISGIFPLVPGAGVYYTAYYFVTNSLVLANQKGMESIKIAFAIVLGIVFVVSIPKRWFVVEFWRQRIKQKKLAR